MIKCSACTQRGAGFRSDTCLFKHRAQVQGHQSHRGCRSQQRQLKLGWGVGGGDVKMSHDINKIHKGPRGCQKMGTKCFHRAGDTKQPIICHTCVIPTNPAATPTGYMSPPHPPAFLYKSCYCVALQPFPSPLCSGLSHTPANLDLCSDSAY